MSDSNQSPRQTPGEMLKEVRQSKGLTLDRVHQETKIPLDVLKAIEEGYTVRTLSPFYLRGFIKMYAQFLDLNPELFSRSVGDTPKETSPVNLSLRRTKKINISLEDFRLQKKQVVAIAGVILFFVFVIVVRAGCSKKRSFSARQVHKTALKDNNKKTQKPDSRISPSEKTPLPRAKMVKTAQVQSTSQALRGSSRAQSGAALDGTVAAPIVLTLKAKKAGWLQVKVDGRIVFQSTLKKGVVETWKAKEKVEISGKSIHFLEYELNGQILEDVGATDRSARRIIITKDGFSIKK